MAGYDLRTLQDLLGQKDAKMTQIYTHVMQKPGRTTNQYVPNVQWSFGRRIRFYPQYVTTNPTASKISIRPSTLIHALRFGGRRDASSSKNCFASSSVISCFVPLAPPISRLRNSVPENFATLSLRCLVKFITCRCSLLIRGDR